MPRSGAAVRRRLQEAALELFSERGYDSTTAAMIAERAGVNHRTFFRHFADKREVLFEGEELLRDRLIAGLLEVPADVGPLPALQQAFRATVPAFEAARVEATPRVAAIEAHPALRERAGAKQAFLAEALAAGLEQRGLDATRALLAAQIGTTAFTGATHDWLADPEAGLDAHLDHHFALLRDLASGAGTAPS